jgi:hypothetical protein
MMSGILTDILRFKINNNEPIGMSSWSTSGVVHDFISVPESISEDDFNRNAKRTGWLDEVLDKCGSDEHSVVRIPVGCLILTRILWRNTTRMVLDMMSVLNT